MQVLNLVAGGGPALAQAEAAEEATEEEPAPHTQPWPFWLKLRYCCMALWCACGRKSRHWWSGQ
eukprot:699719-Prorocentrum_lima.AAC.1